MSGFISDSVGFLLVAGALAAAGYFNEERYVRRYRIIVFLPYILLFFALCIALVSDRSQPFLLFGFLASLALALQMICRFAEKRQKSKKSKGE
jgi:peptidoglycan/LPS O-acetylase OafA/YrhL